MRKGLFAIVLVAAAFGGGAAVNGPGLRWAKEMIWSQTGSEGENEDPSDLVQPSVGPLATTEDPASPAPGADKKDEPFSTDPPRKEKPKPSAAGPKAPEPSELQSTDRPELKSPENRAPDSDGAPAASLDELPPLKVPAQSSGAPPELLPPKSSTMADFSASPTVPLPLEETPTSAAPSKEPGNKLAENAKDPLWADLPGSAPAAAVPPRPYGKPTDRDPAAAAAATPASVTTPSTPGASRSAGDWGEIRRKMRDLGITRYGMEGEPAGRVRFHCIIPVAGKRAVGQHFEAEGDDELQAATTALRRVALWRATEGAER